MTCRTGPPAEQVPAASGTYPPRCGLACRVVWGLGEKIPRLFDWPYLQLLLLYDLFQIRIKQLPQVRVALY